MTRRLERVDRDQGVLDVLVSELTAQSAVDPPSLEHFTAHCKLTAEGLRHVTAIWRRFRIYSTTMTGTVFVIRIITNSGCYRLLLARLDSSLNHIPNEFKLFVSKIMAYILPVYSICMIRSNTENALSGVFPAPN